MYLCTRFKGYMSKIISCLFGILFTLSVTAQNVTIDLGGSISCENRSKLQGALINVTRDGKPFTSFLTSFEGTYYVYLPIGAEYLVDVSKKGYVHKRFTVDTRSIPKERTLEKFPLIVADLELIDYQEGVDYSLFNQPINKYYYNPSKENFEYDKEYLEQMLALIEDIKRANKQAIADAKQKSEKAVKDALHKEQMQSEALVMQELEKELAAAKKHSEEKLLAAQLNTDITITAVKPAVADALNIAPGKKARIAALLLKYKPGVTEEIIEGPQVIIIQRVLVRDDMAWVYQKKIFSWGGVSCFRDGEPITESTFELETRNV